MTISMSPGRCCTRWSCCSLVLSCFLLDNARFLCERNYLHRPQSLECFRHSIALVHSWLDVGPG